MSEHAQAEPVSGSATAAGAPRIGLVEEAVDLWKRLPHKLLFAILFGAWIALFHYFGNATMGYAKTGSLFTWARSVYVVWEDDARVPYIPFVVLFFLWQKRKELSEISPKIWWPGVSYFIAAILLHFAGYRVQQARISILAFMFGLHALIGMIWGPDALRRTIFPIFLLIFCVPLGSIADPLTFNLRMLVTKISVGIGHDILGIQVFRDGSQILGPHGRAMYDVAPACSGMRSLIAMAALSVIYAFLHLDIPWRRLVLVACALPLALLSNIVRVTTVIIVGELFGQDKAAMIEQKFGFITFAFAIGGVMFVGWLLSERKKPAPPKPSNRMEEIPA
jgi:exosortase